MKENRMMLQEVLESRSIFYETLASLYFKPLTEEQIKSLAQTDFSAYADINERFAQGLEDISRYLRKQNTGTRQELAVDFTSAFAGTKTFEGRSAVPYKSVFVDEEGLLYGDSFKEVFSIFKKEAIKKRDGMDWPDDHLSFMCEFMALESRRTAEALKKGDEESARHALKISLTFLEDHIMSWFDALEKLANFILKTSFYRGVLAFTGGYFELDRETLQDLLLEIEE